MKSFFEIDSVVLEKDFRMGIKTTVPKKIYIPLLMEFFCLFFLGYLTLSEWESAMPVIKILDAAILTYICYLIISILKKKNKAVREIIDKVALRTGSRDLRQHLSFYENEIIMTDCSNLSPTHIIYSMIKIIWEFNGFLIFSGDNFGVYVSKNCIPDDKAFYDFIWSKCPNAKYKKYNK